MYECVLPCLFALNCLCIPLYTCRRSYCISMILGARPISTQVAVQLSEPNKMAEASLFIGNCLTASSIVLDFSIFFHLDFGFISLEGECRRTGWKNAGWCQLFSLFLTFPWHTIAIWYDYVAYFTIALWWVKSAKQMTKREADRVALLWVPVSMVLTPAGTYSARVSPIRALWQQEDKDRCPWLFGQNWWFNQTR